MEMRLPYRAIASATMLLWPAAVFGITLSNHDTADQKFIVIEGDTQTDRVIKAGEKLELCQKSCVIRLPEGEDYEFDGPENVSIEDGILFLDTPGDQGQASQ
jgi:hypothetical protein